MGELLGAFGEMRESYSERAVCQFARDHGCLVLKLAGPNAKGQPDRLILKDGKALFIEFKAVGKKPTLLQTKWIERLRAQGFAAEWTDDIGHGRTLVRENLL